MNPDRFAAHTLAASGVLVAGFCGLCTLQFVAALMPPILEQRSGGSDWTLLLTPLVIGSPGMFLGGSLFHVARGGRRKADAIDLIASAVTVVLSGAYLPLFASLAIVGFDGIWDSLATPEPETGHLTTALLFAAVFACATWWCLLLVRGGWRRFARARASLLPVNGQVATDD